MLCLLCPFHQLAHSGTHVHTLVMAHTHPSNAACFLLDVIWQLWCPWDSKAGVSERMEKSWSPTGPGCPSPASLDLACLLRLRLAAEEAALGQESTRLHVLPVSICFPWKPAGLGYQASPCACSSRALLSVSVSPSAAPSAPGSALSASLFFSQRLLPAPRFSLLSSCLSNHLYTIVPEVFLPLLSLSIILP